VLFGATLEKNVARFHYFRSNNNIVLFVKVDYSLNLSRIIDELQFRLQITRISFGVKKYNTEGSRCLAGVSGDSSDGQGCNLFDPPLSVCCSCVRRRRGCGVPSARHGALRYVRIIQHAYTVIQFTHYQPSDQRSSRRQGRKRRLAVRGTEMNREETGKVIPIEPSKPGASFNRAKSDFTSRDFPRPFPLNSPSSRRDDYYPSVLPKTADLSSCFRRLLHATRHYFEIVEPVRKASFANGCFLSRQNHRLSDLELFVQR